MAASGDARVPRRGQGAPGDAPRGCRGARHRRRGGAQPAGLCPVREEPPSRRVARSFCASTSGDRIDKGHVLHERVHQDPPVQAQGLRVEPRRLHQRADGSEVQRRFCTGSGRGFPCTTGSVSHYHPQLCDPGGDALEVPAEQGWPQVGSTTSRRRPPEPPTFVFFVNDPKLFRTCTRGTWNGPQG